LTVCGRKTAGTVWLALAVAVSPPGGTTKRESCAAARSAHQAPRPKLATPESDEARRAEDLATEGISPLTVKAVQSDLTGRGFYKGPVNGTVDAATSDAIRRYQRASRLAETGSLDGPTLRSLGLR
jgi:peptidoglycan hydrolase-like protein with peptidoglycan-binding domain